MKNKLGVSLMLLVFLAGCAGTARQSIPVIDAGDAGQQPAGHKAVDAYPAPEGVYQQPQDKSLPRLPIQAEEHEYETQDSAEPGQTLAAEPVQQASRAQPAAPVQALLRTAQQQQASGDLNGAAASLERAQRIAPREPQVLYRLAEVRLAQGDAAEAEQLAQRGLSFSSGHAALQAGLWDLIAEAREQRGDRDGAEQARTRARIEL